MLAHRGAPSVTASAATILGDAFQRPSDVLRPGVIETCVMKMLCSHAQVQRCRAARHQIRRRLLHQSDQGLFHARGLGESAVGRAAHADMHERSHDGVVGGEPPVFEIVQGGPQPVRAEAGDTHQIISRDAVIRVRVDQRLHNCQ